MTKKKTIGPWSEEDLIRIRNTPMEQCTEEELMQQFHGVSTPTGFIKLMHEEVLKARKEWLYSFTAEWLPPEEKKNRQDNPLLPYQGHITAVAERRTDERTHEQLKEFWDGLTSEQQFTEVIALYERYKYLGKAFERIIRIFKLVKGYLVKRGKVNKKKFDKLRPDSELRKIWEEVDRFGMSDYASGIIPDHQFRKESKKPQKPALKHNEYIIKKATTLIDTRIEQGEPLNGLKKQLQNEFQASPNTVSGLLDAIKKKPNTPNHIKKYLNREN